MFELIREMLRNQGSWPILLLVFLSATLFAFAFASLTSMWIGVHRRVGQAQESAALATGPGRGTDFQASATRPVGENSELRRLLVMAGFEGGAAVYVYQILRVVTAISFGLLTAFYFGSFVPNQPYFLSVAVSVGMAAAGFYLPKTFVSFRRDRLIEEHRQGFPDFLDLLVICVDAGIGVEQGITKIAAEMRTNYPSLFKNLDFLSLELRAGQSLREALANLADRLGIAEARSFAILVQQTEELGTSLAQTLRVYSEEMRAKRLARAEEKAHSLPVKLVFPLGLFIFPVIFGVTLLPVALKIYKALGI